MTQKEIRFVFFGSSPISQYVLSELEQAGLVPVLKITSAREDLPMDALQGLGADVFVVASLGKILPKELIDMPKHGTLNMHPSLLPHLRGPAPLQDTIRLGEPAGVSIMLLDEEMDHGPVLAQEEVKVEGIPHFVELERILGTAGGKLLAQVLPQWIAGEVEAVPQDESGATYTKLIKKEDGLIDLTGEPGANLRKVRAYSTWPGAHIIFKRADGREIRVNIKDGQILDGQFIPTRVVPEGKKEMDWSDFLRGNS